MFTEPAAGWSDEQETAALTASDGAQFDGLGTAVAITGPGNMASATAPGAGPCEQGAMYIFTRPTTGWSDGHEAAKLTGWEACQRRA